MRVVVVGATGNIGTALLDRLAGEPAVTEVLGLARRLPARSWPKTSFAAADVTRDDLAPHLAGADVVVHVAWLFQPTHRPMVTWSVNVGGTVRLLDAVVRRRIPALGVASSVGAYAPADGREIDERWPTHGLPTAAYGREKAYVERLLDAVEARQPTLRVVRMRPGFVFQRRAAAEQRRLFAGPLLPAGLLRPGLLPLLPYPTGLRFQALHADDAAAAFALAVTRPVRGAFNLAAEPVVDGPGLARVLGTRPVPVPAALVRAVLAVAWHGRAVPVEPALFDLAMRLPVMRTDRARDELGWMPRVEATDALAEALAGMAAGAGAPTAPLAPDSVAGRLRELTTGGGKRP